MPSNGRSTPRVALLVAPSATGACFDSASVVAALDSAETELGAISILVNNAGIAVNKPLLEHDDADWDKVIATNLSGAFVTAREVARQMIRRGVEGRMPKGEADGR